MYHIDSKTKNITQIHLYCFQWEIMQLFYYFVYFIWCNRLTVIYTYSFETNSKAQVHIYSDSDTRWHKSSIWHMICAVLMSASGSRTIKQYDKDNISFLFIDNCSTLTSLPHTHIENAIHTFDSLSHTKFC